MKESPRFRRKRRAKTCKLDLLPCMIRPAQAAKLIGCSVKTLSRRNIPRFRDGGLVRYSKATIKEYIKQCTAAKPQDEQPSIQSLASRTARRTGSRVASSLLSGVLARSPRDQSKEALAMISELRAKDSRSAPNGTARRKSSSRTLGALSPSRELSKIT